MSYFNFNLYTRSLKNVNTGLEYKKGNWGPGNPTKGGRAPIIGHRKVLTCSNCQNETIYKDNHTKYCNKCANVYKPVIKKLQNKKGNINTKYNYTTRNLLRSKFKTYEQNIYNFDLSGNLGNWAGGADPTNNAYLIHDCSCNVSFTSNNPCIATYQPSNKVFSVNTAVSGRSRINRLKYNTIKRAVNIKRTQASWKWTLTNAPIKEWSGISSNDDGTKIMAVETSGNIWLSSDSGVNWVEKVIDGGGHKWTSVTSSSDGTKYAAVHKSSNRIYASTDSGLNWAYHLISTDGDLMSIDSSSDGNTIIAGSYTLSGDSGVGAWVSTNGGVSYTNNTSGPGNLGFDAVTANANGTRLAAIRSMGVDIFISSDSGLSWTAYGTPDPSNNWGSGGIDSNFHGTQLIMTSNSGAKILKETGPGLYTFISAGFNTDVLAVASSNDGYKLAAIDVNFTIWTYNGMSPESPWQSHTYGPLGGYQSWRHITSSYDGNTLILASSNGHILKGTYS